jgi:predicted MPP superfamily phosphohydrolase
VLFIDLVRLGNHFFHFFPDSWYQINSKAKLISFLFVAGTVILLTIAGSWNARTIKIKKLKLQIDKTTNTFTKLNIALVSDIHLGTMIHNSKLEKIVEKINNLKPDIILLAGDVFDEDITTLVEKNTASILTKLKSKYGVFAILGNHEYFSGLDEAIAYLQHGNITVLRDSSVFVTDNFYLVGRDDRSGNRFNKTRKPLEELMNNVDKNYPIILMDHQPFNLEEAQNNGVDLQVSGHTHHGQFFPFNLITNQVYELSWGYKQKGNTHYYVSCGVGTWGPPVRLGNRPEIVKIELEFSNK